jgi:hypothetical protein
MKPFDYNSYMRNNPLLKENLKSDIRSDLKAISGIDPLTKPINKIIKKLDSIAKEKGFESTKTSKDEKPTKNASGVYNLAKWEDSLGSSVELYHTGDDKDLQIAFDGYEMSGNDPVEDWLEKNTWDYYMDVQDPEDDEDYY